MNKKTSLTRSLLAALLTAALLLTLTACGGKQEAPAAAPSEAPAVQVANPVREVTADEVVQAVGIPLYAPSLATDVRYFTINTGDTMIGQMKFTLDGKEYTYRTTYADLDALGLSGMFLDSATETYAEVSYAEGKFLTQGETSVLFWEDVVPGVRYSLSCTACDDPFVLLQIAEETFLPLQETNDGLGYDDMPEECPDLQGLWIDADGSTVELTPVTDFEYTAVIGIFRLAEFTGTGTLDPVGMKLTLDSPNGSAEPVYAEFYSEEDASGRLIISESHWSLLETGTEFSGFIRQPVNSEAQ